MLDTIMCIQSEALHPADGYEALGRGCKFSFIVTSHSQLNFSPWTQKRTHMRIKLDPRLASLLFAVFQTGM